MKKKKPIKVVKLYKDNIPCDAMLWRIVKILSEPK